MTKLLHLYTDIPLANSNTPLNYGYNFSWGMKVTTKLPLWITRFGWWHGRTNVADKPLHVGIFDFDTSELVWQPSGGVVDEIVPGWNYQKIPGGFFVPAGKNLLLTGQWPDGALMPGNDFPSLPFDTPAITVTNTQKSGVVVWPTPPPNTYTNFSLPAIDVQYQMVEPVTTTVTQQDMIEALDDYFNPQTASAIPSQVALYPLAAQRILAGVTLNTDQQGQLDDVQVQVTDTLAYLNGNIGTAAEWSATDYKKAVAALVALLGLASSIITDLNFLKDLWPAGHAPSDHDAALNAHRAATEPLGETLPAFIEAEHSTLLTAVIDQTNEITQILAHGNGTEDIPTITAESDWSNIFRFEHPADFYVVEITSVDLDTVIEDVAGVPVYDHIGFSIPLTVDGLPEYGPRLAIGTQVIRTGYRMGGIILNGRRVLSGHVRAYQYQTP